MNALRRDREDDKLSTADLLNNNRPEQGTRDVRDEVGDRQATTPRQVYNATHESARAIPNRGERDAPDYIPPSADSSVGSSSVQSEPHRVETAGRGAQVVPMPVPPGGPLDVSSRQRTTTQAEVESRRDAPREHAPVGQSLSHAVDQPTTHPIGQQVNQPAAQQGVVTDRQVRSEQLWPPVPAGGTPQVAQPEAKNMPLGKPVQNQAQPVAPARDGARDGATQNALFPEDELHGYRARWTEVQTSFVDEPRRAVQNADHLVANVVKRIAEQFANERENLEKQWDRGDDVNTEDLRQALRRYRAFFDRLLSM